MKRTLMIAIAALGLLLGATACDDGDAVRTAIRQSFPDQYEKALAVAKCESGLNPEAVSPGGGNWGLFQINTIHTSRVQSMGYSWDQITDPYVNSKVARSIYNEVGWSAWACA